MTASRSRARRLLVGRYPGWQRGLRRLPKHLFQGAQWLMDEGGIASDAGCLTVAGAAQVASVWTTFTPASR